MLDIIDIYDIDMHLCNIKLLILCKASDIFMRLINRSGTEDNLSDQEKSDESEKGDRLADQPKLSEKVKSVRKKPALFRRHSYSAWSRSSKRVDKVYTIGCFDLFHEGHIRLFERLRTLGKQVSLNYFTC